ncbi:hypothetical protein SNEBB_006692 [Seison nebaliae]|nr:hypothetical protein SNEBB_006692 [Seison nebaliae]
MSNLLNEEILDQDVTTSTSDSKDSKNDIGDELIMNFPNAPMYEKSYMHRDKISHILMTKKGFLLTASQDGFVKFWKKVSLIDPIYRNRLTSEKMKSLKSNEETEIPVNGIEFVKTFRAHETDIVSLTADVTGKYAASISIDKTIKIFDISGLDMCNIIAKLNYVPQYGSGCWITTLNDSILLIAVIEEGSNVIHFYDALSASCEEYATFEEHQSPVILVTFNHIHKYGISVDDKGLVELWTGPEDNFTFPKKPKVNFDSKLDTSYFQFYQDETVPLNMTFSPDGRFLAAICRDRNIRVFETMSGELVKKIDESLNIISLRQQNETQIPNMEFGRRVAFDKDLEASSAFHNCNIIFDDNSTCIIYATLMGIKIVNLFTNQTLVELGKEENYRFLNLALYQQKTDRIDTGYIESYITNEGNKRAEDALLENDPVIFATAYKKARFYLFTKRLPWDKAGDERDIFNEKPQRKDLALFQKNSLKDTQLETIATLHTSFGDIRVKLFATQCPKTVRNFTTHAKQSYYNNHIFHRVIKRFMIQTGDPTSTGTGGESIWGDTFEDEFHPSLLHDRPYSLSMANAGPNTNGSQFFITVVPCPWLDRKHTVFGRVTDGIDVVLKISNVNVDKNDRPSEEIKLMSITVAK